MLLRLPGHKYLFLIFLLELLHLHVINSQNDLHGFSPQANLTNTTQIKVENLKELEKQFNLLKKQFSELKCTTFKECVQKDVYQKRNQIDNKLKQFLNYDKFKRDLQLFLKNSKSNFDFPFPPENYGQYNLPITQQDMSQKENQFLYLDSNIPSREIRIKQGKLRGVVRELKHKNLKNVEVYLGIPYAAPPVDGLRFMPPGSPRNWPNVRTFDAFSPVCPQNLPDLNHEPLKTMNAGRFNRLKRLIPFLRNQSEDCLYLNIYAPEQEDGHVTARYPVIVYIHGESFEWNSGNPYDGSILASYGRVVVVTVNFRLGILGFLRPGISDYTLSNFGLLDQIAALQWIKENIEQFGGDSSSVTLMGHGTGAACINFLMVSPVSQGAEGLFHKAILMSGTALSDWSLTVNPLQFTIQVAQALNCPLVEANDELVNCLRKKRLSEITQIRIMAPQFKTPFGPLVDYSVVPNLPKQVMGVYQDLFSRYDLLYGMTEWESYHSLNAISLAYGMLERERDQLLREYMHSRFEVLPDLGLATTLSEYETWTSPTNRPAAEYHRDMVLDILNDARFAGPMIQMAQYHSSINPKSYLYVFQHNSKFGEFAGMDHSIAGEEIAYIFGAPLAQQETALSHHSFSIPEQRLSEAVITYFTNFATTGNPNAPRRSFALTQNRRDWQLYDREWPEYEMKNQSYLAIGVPAATVGNHYRQKMTQFWNKILPDLLANPPTGSKKIQYPSITEGHAPIEAPFIPPRRHRPKPTSVTYGVVKTNPDDIPPFYRREKPGLMDGPLKHLEATPSSSPSEAVTSSLTITLVIIIGICFLTINVFAVIVLYYKRFRVPEGQTQRAPSDFDDGGFEERLRYRDRLYEDRKKTEDIYEAVKTRSKDMSRKCSVSTVDPHTKVREWIQQEIHKYSPACLRKTDNKTLKTQMSIETENSIVAPLPSLSKKTKKVEKVSVEVDATPGARSASVLKQIPIELTKSLDAGLARKTEENQQTTENISEDKRASISLQMLPTVMSTRERIAELQRSESLKVGACLKDINVTSRDDNDIIPLMPLDIEKRNYPKVLPDYPNKRLSLPPNSQPIYLPSQTNTLGRKIPPPPPKRTSTLERRKHEPQRVIDNTKEEDIYQSKSEVSQAEIKLKIPEPKPSKLGHKTVIVATPNKCTKRREPRIIIQPTIGPKKQEQKVYVLDSKGPSDRTKPVGIIKQRSIKRVEPESKSVETTKATATAETPSLESKCSSDLPPGIVQIDYSKQNEPPPPKVRTNALSESPETGSSSSSKTVESCVAGTTTLRKTKKETKDAAI